MSAGGVAKAGFGTPATALDSLDLHSVASCAMKDPDAVNADEPVRPPRRTRGRPRDKAADETILQTAREILASDGYDALSFKTLEERTGITRPTIYRRWKTKAHLVSDVAHGVGEHLIETIADGALREQVHALVARVYAQYSRPEIGAASAGLIAAYQRDPALRAELHNPREREARRELAQIVAAARERGQIKANVSAEALFDIIIGTIIFRMIFSHVPPGPTFVDEVSRIILDGITP